MSIEIISSKKLAKLNGIKVLVYGNAGSGKTYLCSTITDQIIISAESGLLSLSQFDIPVIEVKSIQDIREVYKFLALSPEANQYTTVCLDSLTEIGEVVLSAEKKHEKDPRQAYAKMYEQLSDLIRAFRDLPKNIYFSAKVERTKDELFGTMLYMPSMPGNKFAQQVPYYFDFVFPLIIERDEQGEIQRYLQTRSDLQYIAKDRSNKLPLYMTPDLSKLIDSIQTQPGANHTDNVQSIHE